MAGAGEMIFQNPKPNPEGTQPPQPTFYDKPNDVVSLKTLGHWFKENKTLVLVCSVLFVFALWVVFSSKWDKKKTRIIGVEEKLTPVSREDVEQAIEQASANTKNMVKPAAKALEQRTRRNYATDIDVFIFKGEKPPLGFSREKKSSKSQEIGIPSGTRIPAILSNRIFSFNVAAPVIALIVRDYKWKDRVVIPKGAKFLGEASVVKSIDRINVNFESLIFPDGREMRVHAMALSADGSGGIKGKVKKHRDIKAFKAVGEALLGGVSLFAGGVRRDPFSMEDQLRLNVTQNLTNQAEQDLRSVRVDESITAEAYTPIDVMVLEKI